MQRYPGTRGTAVHTVAPAGVLYPWPDPPIPRLIISNGSKNAPEITPEESCELTELNRAD